jgi:hypothetical protein
MEYYPGGTVADLIKREGKVRPKEALNYIRQVSLGLGLAHKKGIIHRDIKPANIFFADDQTLKLGDFGICASYENHDHTMTGEVIGTPLYMAPEQQKNSKDVDPRADIYALAMTLYHMLTGRPPRVVNLEEVPPRIRPLIQQATAYDRKERPASCQQLVAMVDQILKNWDQADEVMRGSSTEMIGAAGSMDSGAPSEGSMGMSSDSAGPRAVSTKTSDPLTPTGESGWDPNEITRTQSRPAPGETTTTTVIQTPNNTWSMVALVGVIILGFLAVIFMLVSQSKPGGQLTAAGERSVVAVRPSGERLVAPPAPEDEGATPDNEPTGLRGGGPAEIAGAGATLAGSGKETLPAGNEGETNPLDASPEPAPDVPGQEAEIPSPAVAEPWNPVQPDWAREDPQGAARGIESFLTDHAGNGAADFTRDTFLALGDWIDKQGSPSASIFRDSARERLKQAAQRYPEEPLFPYLLGRLLEVGGKEAEARRQFEKVGTLDSQFVAEFDRVILDFLQRLDLEGRLSQPLKSFLLTPSSIARDTTTS